MDSQIISSKNNKFQFNKIFEEESQIVELQNYHDNNLFLKGEVDIEIMAHVFCDKDIKNTSLQGADFTKTIDLFLKSLQALKCADLTKIIGFVENLRNNNINIIINSSDECATTLTSNIKSLKNGETIFLPGGWREEKSGHAMLYSFSKVNEKFEFCIYNTGHGIDNHSSIKENYKTKYNPIVKYTNIPLEVLFVSNLEKSPFLETLVDIGKKIQLKFNPDVIYKGILKHLHEYLDKSNEDRNRDSYIISQRSGTCTWKVLMAFLRENLKLEDYKICKFYIRLNILDAFWENECNSLNQQTKESEAKRAILKESCKDFLRLIHKEFSSFISKADINSAHKKTTFYLDEVDKIETNLKENRFETLIPLSLSMRPSQEIRENYRSVLDSLQNIIPNESHAIMRQDYISLRLDYLNQYEIIGQLELISLKLQKITSKSTKCFIIEQLAEMLPINDKNFWDTIKQEDLQPSIDKLLNFVILYKDIISPNKEKTNPKEINAMLTMQASIHVLAIRDGEIGKILSKYKIKDLGSLIDDKAKEDPFFQYTDFKDLSQRERIRQYFIEHNKKCGNGEIFTVGDFDDYRFPSKPEDYNCELSFYKELIDAYKEDIYNNIAANVKYNSLSMEEKMLLTIIEKPIDFFKSINCLRDATYVSAFFCNTNVQKGYFSNIITDNLSITLKGETWYINDKNLKKLFLERSRCNLPRSLSECAEDFLCNKYNKRNKYKSECKEITAINECNNYNTSDKLLLRELFRIATERELQPFQLISYFKNNVSLLNNIDSQTIFFMQFFKTVVVASEDGLKSHIDIVEHFTKNQQLIFDVLDLVDIGIKQFIDLNNKKNIKVTAYSFFVRFAQYSRKFLHQSRLFDKDNNLFSKEIESRFEQVNNYLVWLLENHEFNIEERALLSLHVINGYSHKEIKDLDNREIENILYHWFYISFHKNVLFGNFPILKKEVQVFVYKLIVACEGRKLDLNNLCNFILKKICNSDSNKDKKWDGEFPIFTFKIDDKKNWMIDFLNGNIFNENGAIGSRNPQIDETINREVLDSRNNNWVYDGTVYKTKDKILGDIQYIENNEILQCFKEDTWCSYLKKEELRKWFINFPEHLIESSLTWLKCSNGSKELILTKKENLEILYRLDSEGVLKNSHVSLQTYEKAEECHFSLCNFEKQEYIVYEFKDNEICNLKFPKYFSISGEELSFSLNSSKLLAWKENKNFILPQNVPVKPLYNLKNALYLKNIENNKEKLLVPLLYIKNPKAFSSKGSFDFTKNEKKHYLEFNIENGKIIYNNISGLLFLSYLNTHERDYEKAVNLLRQVQESDKLSDIDLEIINEIIEYGKHVNNPSITAIILHANILLIKNNKINKNLSAYYSKYLELKNAIHVDIQLSKDEELSILDKVIGNDVYLIRKLFINNGNIQWIDKKNLQLDNKIVDEFLVQDVIPYYHINGYKNISDYYQFNIENMIKKNVDHDELFWQVAQKLSNSDENEKKEILFYLNIFLSNATSRSFVFLQFLTINLIGKNVELPNQKLIDNKDYSNKDWAKGICRVMGWNESLKISPIVNQNQKNCTSHHLDKNKLGRPPEDRLPLGIKNYTLKLTDIDSKNIFQCVVEKYFKVVQKEKEEEIMLLKEGYGIADFITDEKRRYLPAIEKEIDFFKKDIALGKSLLDESESFSFDRNNIDRLDKELRGLSYTEIDDIKKQVLLLANKQPTDEKDKLKFGIGINGLIEKKITIQDVEFCFLTGKREYFKRLNPRLSDEDINELFQLIGFFEIKSIHNQQLERAIDLIAVLKKEKDELSYNYYVQELAKELKKEFSYENLEQFDPAFLIFTHLSNMIPTKDQVKNIKDLLEGKSCLIQKMMGGGKTAIIASMWGHLQASRGKLPIIFAHSSQYSTVVSNLMNVQKKCFNREILTLNYQREELDLTVLKEIKTKLHRIQNEEKLLVMTPETLQTLDLEFKSLQLIICDNRIKENEEKIVLLQEILAIFKTKGCGLGDEIDLILKSNHEVNFPSNDFFKISPDKINLVKEIFSILTSDTIKVNEKLLKELVGIKSSQCTSLTHEDYINLVVPTVGEHLAEHIGLLDVHKNYFKEFIIGKIDKNNYFLKYISDLYSSNNKNDKQIATLICLSKHILMEVLPKCLQKSLNRNFGRWRGQGGKNTKNTYGKVIPFNGVDTPATTEFGYHYEALCFYFMTALQGGIDNKQILEIANKMNNTANQYMLINGETFSETAETRAFKEITGVDLSAIEEGKNIEIAKQNINNSTKALLDFEGENCGNHIEIHKNRLTSNSQCIVPLLSSMCAMTGTPYNVDGYTSSLSEKIILENGSEGKIIHTLLKKANVTQFHKIENFNIDSFLNTLTQRDDLHKICAFMDYGGLLKDRDNIKVAVSILNFLKNIKSEKKGVVFFYKSSGSIIPDKLVVLMKDAKEPILLKGTSVEDLEKVGLGPNDVFYIYDEIHNTGIDFKLPPTAIGLMTIDESSTIRGILQTVMRARQFVVGEQKIEFIVTKNAEKKLINGEVNVNNCILSSAIPANLYKALF